MTPLDVCGLSLILNMKPKDSSCYLSILYAKNQDVPGHKTWVLEEKDGEAVNKKKEMKLAHKTILNPFLNLPTVLLISW